MSRVKRKQVHIYTFLPIHYTFFAIVEAKDATAEGATWDEEGEAGKDRKVPLLCLRITLSILISQQMAARFMKFIRKGAEDTRIFYELDLPRTNDYFVQTFYDYLAPYVIICFTVREH